jgi:hypothetical protein
MQSMLVVEIGRQSAYRTFLPIRREIQNFPKFLAPILARAKGKRLGRPRAIVDATRTLRAQGLSWARFGEELGVGEGTIRSGAYIRQKPPQSGGYNPL